MRIKLRERIRPIKDIYPIERIMRISSKGIDLIAHFEGVKLRAYQDTGGIWTVGYGTTHYPDGRKIKEEDIISLEYAKTLFAYDLRKFETIVLSKVKRELLQREFDALVSFCYNCGTSYKSGGKWKDYNIWKLAQNKTITPEYWQKLAITDNGIVLEGLILRRKAESNMYFEPK